MTLSEYLEQENLTQEAFAELLGVTQGAVNYWIRAKIPPDRAREIEELTGGKLKREDLRPDLFGPISPPRMPVMD